jgi:hypothetical protein
MSEASLTVPGVATFHDRAAAEAAAAELAGHAIVLDLQFDHNDVFLEARLFHYRTCFKCVAQKSAAGAQKFAEGRP